MQARQPWAMDSNIFANEDFGYTKIVVGRPLCNEQGELVLKAKKKQSDVSLRDTESVSSEKTLRFISSAKSCPLRPMRGLTKEE